MGFFDFFRNIKSSKGTGSKKITASYSGAGSLGGDSDSSKIVSGRESWVDGLDYLNKENVDLKKMFSYLLDCKFSVNISDPKRVELVTNLEVSEDRYLQFKYEFFMSSREKDVLITCYKSLYKKRREEDYLIDIFSKTVRPVDLRDMGYVVSTTSLVDNLILRCKFGKNSLDVYSRISDDSIVKALYNGENVERLVGVSETTITSIRSSEAKIKESKPSKNNDNGVFSNSSIFG